MRWIALAALALTCAGQTATVHTWTDDDGVLHYSDRPAENSAELVVAAPNIIDPYAAPRRPDATAEPRRPKRRAAPEKTADRAAAQRCQKARSELQKIRSIRRLGYRASEDRALRDRRREARQARAANCN